jgi:phosphoglucosamine mutase
MNRLGDRERIFGTDGIRGRAGEGWLAPGPTARVGHALGDVLGGHLPPRKRRVLLGHDGRRSGPGLERALAGGLASAGFTCVSTGLITTPGLAWLTRTREFGLGVMVSASHNPSEDNGIKVFSGEGAKLSDELEGALEERLQQAGVEPEGEGELQVDSALEEAYLDHLVNEGASDLRLSGMTLALDCANGGGSRVGPRVFGRLGANLHTLAAEPDGENINHECGSTHLANLRSEVQRRGAGVGIALDGDGDRCLLVDERGETVHGDGILTVLSRRAMELSSWRDPRIVATVMSNRGLHVALREVGVSVVEVGVGDRQVVEALQAEKLPLGGEQSGHVILGEENAFIGDGIYTALAVLRVMRQTGKRLSELAAPYQPFPQVLINVRVARQPNLSTLPEVVEEVRRIEQLLSPDGRVLLRYSGTEPLARVMVEGPDAAEVDELARGLAAMISESLAT